jgi:hypothetical protein
MVWANRSREERALLNPALCAELLWYAARGCVRDGDGLSFEEAFLVLPFVLHRTTREALPRGTRTSLAVWLDSNPLARGRIATRARLLVPFTKEAIMFGGVHGLLQVQGGRLEAVEAWRLPVNRAIRASSDEVRECAKKSEFIGKWFEATGRASTVMALLGVRP